MEKQTLSITEIEAHRIRCLLNDLNDMIYEMDELAKKLEAVNKKITTQKEYLAKRNIVIK